jgi:aminodeoxyfutalosine deaminase
MLIQEDVSFLGMDTLEAFVSALPKVELHVHLVGSASLETVLSLARRHPERGVPTSEDGLREFYVFTDFPHFLGVYRTVSGLISEPEDIADLVRGIGRDLAAQNVRYVELQASPYSFQRHGMPDAAISEALSVGARDALARYGVRIGYIIDFPGQDAGVYARPALRFALETPPDGLIGFGIGGLEAGRAPYTDVIRDVFGAAHAAGLRCVPHAGETTGAETVWEAIGFLHAERIGHGIRSLDDPSLVSYLAERRLPVDVSPTSNVCTRCIPSIAEHPLRRMIEAGLFVTLNSDDPPMFGTSLSNEYLVAGRDLGLSPAELAELAGNGVRASFLDPAAKEALLTEIAAVPLP